MRTAIFALAALLSCVPEPSQGPRLPAMKGRCARLTPRGGADGESGGDQDSCVSEHCAQHVTAAGRQAPCEYRSPGVDLSLLNRAAAPPQSLGLLAVPQLKGTLSQGSGRTLLMRRLEDRFVPRVLRTRNDDRRVFSQLHQRSILRRRLLDMIDNNDGRRPLLFF